MALGGALGHARDAAALALAQTHIHRFCMAGVAFAWRAWTGLVARDARDAAALCGTLRGRRGTWHWVARLDWLGRP